MIIPVFDASDQVGVVATRAVFTSIQIKILRLSPLYSKIENQTLINQTLTLGNIAKLLDGKTQ